MPAFVSWAALYISPNCFKGPCCFSQGKIASGWRSHPPQARPPSNTIKFRFTAGKPWRSKNYHGIYLHEKSKDLTKKLSRTTTREQPAKCSHYLCSCHCRASTSTGLSQIMLQHLSSWVPVTTCVEKAVYRSLSVQTPRQRVLRETVNRHPCKRAWARL